MVRMHGASSWFLLTGTKWNLEFAATDEEYEKDAMMVETMYWRHHIESQAEHYVVYWCSPIFVRYNVS